MKNIVKTLTILTSTLALSLSYASTNKEKGTKENRPSDLSCVMMWKMADKMQKEVSYNAYNNCKFICSQREKYKDCFEGCIKESDKEIDQESIRIGKNMLGKDFNKENVLYCLDVYKKYLRNEL